MEADKGKYVQAGREHGALMSRQEYILSLLVLVVAFAAAVVLYQNDRHVFLFYGDAASHMVKAREIIELQGRALESIGPVWLPVPQLVLAPFAAFDVLYFSGIAGAFVGIPCLLGTALLLFSIVRRLTASSPIALLSACLFCLNPNVVYIALTPMTEPCLFFFLTLSAYAVLRWTDDGKTVWLVWCVAALILATLTRYEAWVLVPFLLVTAATRKFSAPEHAGAGERVRIVAISMLSLAGIALWACWNRFEFGDALKFAPWKYRPSESYITALMSYRQEAVPLTILRSVLNIFGPALLLASIAGTVRVLRGSPGRRMLLTSAFLVLPTLFIVTGILMGYVLIDEWGWNWRFLLPFGLFLAVTGGIGLAWLFENVRSRSVRGLAVALLLAMPVVQLTLPSVGVATYNDAAHIFSGPDHYAAAFGEQLGSIHKGGSIALLVDPSRGERIMVSSGLPLKDFHVVRVPGGEEIVGPIRSGDRYVVIGKEKTIVSAQMGEYWLSRRDQFLRLYSILAENEHYILLERKNDDTPAGY